MLRLSALLFGFLTTLLAPAPLLAQAADSGTFVIRHSGDTVATESFARTETSLRGTLAIKNYRSTSQRYSAVVAPDLTLPLIEITVREDADSGRVKAKLVQRARFIFRDDSAAVDAVIGQSIQTRVFGTQRGAIPYLNMSFALLEQAVRRARSLPGGLTDIPFFNLGGGQTVNAKLSPIGADSLNLAIGTVEYHLRVDPRGRLLGAVIPAQNVTVERMP
ncbi:MAG: hypothetical protein H0T90_00620 [Gemmatimonadales bacterium]|nr:hypothetical protein [Gemmatimonadales bacterium]